MGKTARLLFTGVNLLFLAGCGSQSQVPSAPLSDRFTSNVPVGLTVTDTPPAGVTVLFFQLNITGAALESQSGVSASLLSSTNPIPVNVSQLQTDSAFLANASVAGGTYTSLSLTFANPQLTIYNGSGAAIGSCANSTVCQLQPATTPLTLTFSTAPFPVTLTTNSPLAFKLDIHLNTIIQTDLTVNLGATNGVTVSQLPPPSSGAPIPGLGHLTGTIQSLTTSGFTVQTVDGRTFSIGVNSSTTYDYPNSVCSTDDFSCVALQQIVKVEVSIETAGTLLASEVDYVQPAAQTMVEGSIIRLTASAGNTLVDLILQQGPVAPSTLPLGQRVTVTVPPAGVTYAVDPGTFTLPSGLSFTNASNLMVGQEVWVVVQGGAISTPGGSRSSTPFVGPAAITFITNSITLEPSQITGTVSDFTPISLSGSNFILATYPNYFLSFSATAGASLIPAPVNLTVQATSATTFTNLTPDSISGLAVGDVVSVNGWLFPYSAIPQICNADRGCAPLGEIAAETVIGRPGPIPLF
jgi:hypothetical protein